MPTATLRSLFVNDATESLRYRLDPPTHDAVTELLGLYNPLSGPVRKLVTYYGAAGGFPVHVGHTEYYDVDHVLRRITGLSSLSLELQSSLFGGGKGGSLHDMHVSSLAETVERLLGSLYYFTLGREHLFGTVRELARQGVRCLRPEELHLFAPEQHAREDFLYEPFTEDTPLAWLVGRRLFSGDEVAAPAQLVEILYLPRPDEALVGYSVSGGLASHVDRTHALFHGITELIERDAVNVHWYTRIPPARIVVDQPPASAELRRLLRRAEALPGEIGLYHHAVDFPEVPVVTAVQRVPWLRRYGWYAGGGGDVDAEATVVKALNEFGQSERTIKVAQLTPERQLAAGVARIFSAGPDDPLEKLTMFLQVIGYYGHRANRAKLDWYLEGGEEVPLSALPRSPHRRVEDKLASLCELLRRRGMDPLVFDLTPPSLRHVVLTKVFIPELTQPFLQSQPMHGHPRFAQAPVWLGRRSEPLPFAELTADPLPYP